MEKDEGGGWCVGGAGALLEAWISELPTKG